MKKIKIITFLLLIFNDLLFSIGGGFILLAAYRFNLDIGFILTGVLFMFFALLMSKKRG